VDDDLHYPVPAFGIRSTGYLDAFFNVHTPEGDINIYVSCIILELWLSGKVEKNLAMFFLVS
jgi:hypothetical protein